MSPLKIASRDAASGPVLEIAGPLDYTHATALRDHVSRCVLGPGQCLTLDLADMEFCDSTGMSILIAARNHALAAGADIALTAVPPDTLRVMRIVGLDQIFTIRPAAGADGL
ncbi:STAS domain-containing protein [Streptomyces sp. NPDC005574]|uniref:STAS domain-containing protein n=1 Tax=Streptomyces sp. NPDC005574 TaxID=3156891 RepID=UPI0033B93937